MNSLTHKEKILNFIKTLDQQNVKVLKSNKPIFPWMRRNINYIDTAGMNKIVDRDFDDFINEEFLARLQLENPNNTYYTNLQYISLIIWFRNCETMVKFLEFIQDSNDGNLFSELHEIIGIESKNIYTSINDIQVMSIWLTPATDKTIPSPTLETIFPEG